MTGRKYESPLHIDMDPDEALERFVKTDPAEVKGTRARGKKKAGRRERPAGESDEKGERQGDRERQPP